MSTELPRGLRPSYTYGLTTTTPGGRYLPEPHLITICTLVDDTDKPICKGVAVYNPADPFNAALAHEVSKGRALKNLAGKFFSVEVEETEDEHETRVGKLASPGPPQKAVT